MNVNEIPNRTTVSSSLNKLHLLGCLKLAVFLTWFGMASDSIAGWRVSSYGVSFAGGSPESICRSAIGHHASTLAALNAQFSDQSCYSDQSVFLRVDPMPNANQRRCSALRTITYCNGHVGSYEWGLTAWFWPNLGAEAGETCNNTDNPINLSTGNKFYSHTDIESPIQFNRYYNSFGGGWSSDYRQALNIYPDIGVATAERNDGRSIDFTIDGSGYIAPANRKETLVWTGTTYELTLADATIETYDSEGQLIEIDPPRGSHTAISYVLNEIHIVRNGKSLAITLDDSNRISSVSTSGRSVVYEYEIVGGAEQLVKAIYDDNSYLQYKYGDDEQSFFISAVIDEEDQTISSVKYDHRDRAIQSEIGPLDQGAERISVNYSSTVRGKPVTVTNSLGKETTYTFKEYNGNYQITSVEGHASENCAARNRSTTYDANGFKDIVTDWEGNITDYDHDSEGREISRTEGYGTPEAVTVTTEWHTDYRLPTKMTYPDKIVDFVYDEHGNLVSRTESPNAP